MDLFVSRSCAGQFVATSQRRRFVRIEICNHKMLSPVEREECPSGRRQVLRFDRKNVLTIILIIIIIIIFHELFQAHILDAFIFFEGLQQSFRCLHLPSPNTEDHRLNGLPFLLPRFIHQLKRLNSIPTFFECFRSV